MKKFYTYRLEFISFFSGAIVMVLELVGARVLAPYFGTSINTWTVLIGIVLGSLSLGYWYGGRLADKQVHIGDLAKLLFFSGLNLIGVALLKDYIIYGIGKIPFLDLTWGSILATIILFVLPNVLLGMVSPFIVKLKLKSLTHSGNQVGTLYAISTLGSIVGTFGAGFVLIPLLGISKIILLMGIVLLLGSLLLSPSKNILLKLILIFCSISILYTFTRFELFAKKEGLIDIDSLYGRIFVYNTIHPITHIPATYLITGAFGFQSGKSGNSVSPYISSSDLIVKTFAADKKKMLVIGGGAFSLPDYFLTSYPTMKVDVVEIDPEISHLASSYFDHKQNARLNTYLADGRTYINSSTSRYDIIINDAYTDVYPPYNLSTKEAVQKIYELLGTNGLSIANVISPLEGKNNRLFQAMFKTYSSVFPHVLAFPLQKGANPDDIQNILLVGIKNPSFDNAKISQIVSLHQYVPSVSNSIPILTDDFAPVESYLLSITTQKPLYPMSRYFLNTYINTSNKFLLSLLKLT